LINNISIRTIFRSLTILILIIFTVLFLIPTQDLPEQSIFKWWDKAQHAFVFMALTTVTFLAFPTSYLKVSIYLLMYGGFIELLQAMTSWRKGDFYDWVADAFGILIIFIVMETFNQISFQRSKKLKEKIDVE
jgi:VanZ family protein